MRARAGLRLIASDHARSRAWVVAATARRPNHCAMRPDAFMPNIESFRPLLARGQGFEFKVANGASALGPMS